MITTGLMLLHDYAHRNTDALIGETLEHFNRELFDRPLYSHDLALSSYHMFTYLKNWF
jgi:hypothetical protein